MSPEDPETFETAIEHVSRRVPIARPEDRVGDVRNGWIGQKFDSASHLVVCDGDRFVGIARIEELLAAPDDKLVGAIMDPDAPSVGPGVDQEIAAWRAVRSEESALAVVDPSGRFVGLIPPHRLLGVLLSEHDEDLARLGGLLRSTSDARTSSEEPVERRFRHRIPWLLVGLGGALLAADIVGWFESQLRDTLALAFFIPGIVYLADAVGTQTETIVVRGLSVGVSMRSMMGRELLAGLAIGVALALIAGPVVWWRWGDPQVALVVGLSIAGACSIATVLAMALPMLFDSLGRDPAFGSGPLATVTQDLLSILIYFGIALAVVR